MRIRRFHAAAALVIGMAVATTPVLAAEITATAQPSGPSIEPSPFIEAPFTQAPATQAPATQVPVREVKVEDGATAIAAELSELATAARPNTGRGKPPKPPKPLPPPKLQCTSAGVEAFVRRYAVTFNRGKMTKVKRFFAAKNVPIAKGKDGSPIVVNPDRRGFRWYTVGAAKRGTTKSARRYFIGRNRNRVGRYIALRRKRGESLRYVTTTGFQSIDVGGAPHAGIAFLMKRRANDLLPRRRWRTVKGKALVDCQSGKISVFSI